MAEPSNVLPPNLVTLKLGTFSDIFNTEDVNSFLKNSPQLQHFFVQLSATNLDETVLEEMPVGEIFESNTSLKAFTVNVANGQKRGHYHFERADDDVFMIFQPYYEYWGTWHECTTYDVLTPSDVIL